MKIINYSATNEERIDILLRKIIPLELKDKQSEINISNSKIRRLIVSGSVYLNARQCRVPSAYIKRGDKIKINLDEEKFLFEKQPDDIKFEVTSESVLFEDESIIVINKPAFFPTEETITQKRDNLHAAVIRYLWNKNPSLRNPPYVGVMHRLDRETSGVILFSKTRGVNKNIFEMFEKHTAHKQYRAVCYSSSSPKDFICHEKIGRVSSSSAACKMGVPKGTLAVRDAKEAITKFIIAGKKDNLIYIDAYPETGRTHQIRVHLSFNGLPILGDVLYGGKEYPRIMLHAFSLTFPHPVTGKILCIESPLPQEFVCHLQ